MHPSRKIFLINDAVRAVSAEYEPKGNTTLLKTMDPDLKVGDFVVCETDTRHNMTVSKIVDVDVDIDLESPVNLPWVISCLDLVDHEKLIAAETDALAKIKSAQDKKKRDELRAAMAADYTDDVRDLELNTIAGELIEPPKE